MVFTNEKAHKRTLKHRSTAGDALPAPELFFPDLPVGFGPLIPAVVVADSLGNSGGWYRAQGWSGGCAPKMTLISGAVEPSPMGQHQGRLV
jgi:hypothetical protein